MKPLAGRVRVLFIIVFVLFVLLGIKALDIFYGPNSFSAGGEKTFYISRGQTFPSIVDSLETNGIIRSRAEFVFVGKFLGGTNRIQIGKYIPASGISNYDLFVMIRDGLGAHLITVTIPEGLISRVQARILARAIGIDSARYIHLVNDETLAHSLGIESHSLEGYLFPETYKFYWQQDEKDVIVRLVDQFKFLYGDSLQARAKEFGWTTNQVMTLASIVEGEAVLDAERRTISGVYHNRLRKGMRLEADPTIRFLIEDGRRRVLYSDLQTENPYNTYRNKGLPPGPVNNPGRSSIFAALYPENNNYIFFVANGNGGHWFSTNYSDHMRHVRRFRKNRALGAAQ
jgi:UPF0755 protein